MNKISKFYLVLFLTGFLFVLAPTNEVTAGQCQIRINFQAQPNPVPENGTLNLTGYVDMRGSVWEGPGSQNQGYCYAGTTLVNKIYVQFVSSGGYTGLLAQNFDINLEPGRDVAYGFSRSFRPAVQFLKSGASFVATAQVSISGTTQKLTVSSPIIVNVIGSAFGAYGCLTQNTAGQNVYACSPTNSPSCSDVSACQGKPCVALGDSRLCTGPVTATHKECRNNACVIIPGAGQDACSTNANCGGGGGTTTADFEIENPIGISTFEELVNVIGTWIFNLAIPIAVIIIIYAGVLMLTAGGNPGNFKKGMDALKYAVIGLAIVLIGKGFVTLIKSILSLKN